MKMEGRIKPRNLLSNKLIDGTPLKSVLDYDSIS